MVNKNLKLHLDICLANDGAVDIETQLILDWLDSMNKLIHFWLNFP